jgi:hypothetical protein
MVNIDFYELGGLFGRKIAVQLYERVKQNASQEEIDAFCDGLYDEILESLQTSNEGWEPSCVKCS